MSEFGGQMVPGTNLEYGAALHMLGAVELGEVLPALEATSDALNLEIEMSSNVDDFTVLGNGDHMIVRETHLTYEVVDLSTEVDLLAMKGLAKARARLAEHHELTQIAPVGFPVEADEMKVTHSITVEDTSCEPPRKVASLHSVPVMIHFDPVTEQETKIEVYEGYQPTPDQLRTAIEGQGERTFWLAAIFTAKKHQASAA